MNKNLVLTILFLTTNFIVAMDQEESFSELKEKFAVMPEEVRMHVLKFVCGTGNFELKNIAKKLLEIIETEDENNATDKVERMLKCIKILYPESKDQANIFKTKDTATDATPLVSAIVANSKPVLQKLLNHINNLDESAQIEILKDKDKDGINAFTSAVINGFIVLMKLILNQIGKFPENVQVEIINSQGLLQRNTALMRAAARANKKDVRIIELILDHIKNFSKENRNKILNTRNIFYETALQRAISRPGRSKERLSIIKLLREASK